jgi:O-antigen ligase
VTRDRDTPLNRSVAATSDGGSPVVADSLSPPRAGSDRRPRASAGASRKTAAFEVFLCRALLVILALAPMPFGGARPWAWSALGMSAVLLLWICGIHDLVKPPVRTVLAQLRPVLVMWGLLAGWIVFQSLPWDIFGWHHPVWDKASEVLGKKLDMSLSVDPEESWIRLFRLLTYAGYFFIAWRVGRSAENASLIIRAIACLGAFYAIYGLFELSSLNPHILWFLKTAYRDDVTSTFVNRNSYATYAGISVIANLGVMARLLVKNLDLRTRRTVLLSVADSMLGKGKWPLIGIFFTGAALLLSHSRGGAISTFLGVAALLAAVSSAPSVRGAGRVWLAGFIVLACLASLLLSGAATIGRLADTSVDTELRLEIARATLRAIDDNWYFGTGLGTFQYIFPLYQPASIAGFVDMAHDDYLENVLELGVPAACLFFASLVYVAVRCCSGVRRRRKDVIYPCLAVAATVLVGVHSALDFSMQIPAVAITYAVILGARAIPRFAGDVIIPIPNRPPERFKAARVP